MSNFMEAMAFRHACKKFDPSKKIPAEQFTQILEFGRKSPSSFGLEHWKFLVIQTPELREQLKAACWGQAQISDSSHVVVILAKTKEVEPDQAYAIHSIKRRGLPEEMVKAYMQRYAGYLESEVYPITSIYAWSSKQCYLALANMMTGAASLGIDSCPMEGFSKKAVEEVLNIDTSLYQVAVVVAFGYRAGAASEQMRLPLDAVVEYR
ncbi:NAD(P)H-dependent oxidoreductase [Thiofilum flexile]|uniref:NAD(P)H-dependent oxidoreductase n=1 Tax=Thiofilum flexile TaxID=125627 RepID=UPI0003681570|nr:NAD(P)H-dependent oxidoreductase [Thiofilum flexile]